MEPSMSHQYENTPPDIDKLTNEDLKDYYLLWSSNQITLEDFSDYLRTDKDQTLDLLIRGKEHYQGGKS
jgi:hypothetical protein